MSKVPVSVCIIARNEEKYIEECLKHLQPYGFEVVVTDTGSEDRTVEIAQKYADKVVAFEWINDFSAARNFCADHASNNWILSLDCDEYITDVNIKVLRELMQRFPRHVGTMRLKNLIRKEDGTSGYGTDDVTRLYNRNFYLYDRPIHEQISSRNAAERDNELPCFLMPMEVIHHGYAISQEEMERKQHRNLDILYHALETTPEDPYLLFQIGQSEFILKNNEKVGVHLACMDKYAEQCKTAKYTFTHASVNMDNKQPLKALLLYIKTTMMPDADTLGENLLHCYEYIIRLYREMGDEKMAALFHDKYIACKKERERVLAEE